MTPSERERSERLDRYWDALAGDPGDLDPALPDTVRELRAMHQPPAIDPAFQRRLGEQLFGTPAPPGVVAGLHPLPPLDPVAHSSLNGHAPDRTWDASIAKPGRRWPTSQLAAAAVLALALIGSLLAVRFVQPKQDLARNVLDAASRPAVETLFDGTVENSAESWTPLAVERWTFQPGEAALSIPPLAGPQWIVAEGSGLVLDLDGEERDLPVGTGITIATGQEMQLRNSSAGTVSALRGFAAASFALADHDRAFISEQTALDTEAHEALPPGASRVVFERLTLLAGTTFQLEPATGQDWIAVTSGRLGLTLLGDGLPLNWRSGREREVADDELLPALVPGTRVTLRNIGDEPLVVLRLRVLPAAGETAASSVSHAAGTVPASVDRSDGGEGMP